MNNAALRQDLDGHLLRAGHDLGDQRYGDNDGALFVLRGGFYRHVHLHLILATHKHQMMVVALGGAWGVAHHVAVLLHVDKLIFVRPVQLDDCLKVVGRPIHDHASNADRLASMHLLRAFAVEMHWPDGVIGDRVVDDADAVLLADAEDVEVPGVRGERHVEIVELLAILVDVDVEPAPLPVPDVVEVGVAVEPREAEVGGRLLLLQGIVAAVRLVVACTREKQSSTRGHVYYSKRPRYQTVINTVIGGCGFPLKLMAGSKIRRINSVYSV